MAQAPTEKPYFLLIETATPIAALAVYHGRVLLGHIEIRLDKSHARLLAPLVQQLLQNVEIQPQDLAAIAISKGPGSYTGLRVGVSTVKGLAMAINKPIIALPSLQLIASQAQSWAQKLNAWICPMIDARRMEVYTCLYNADLVAQTETAPLILEQGVFDEVLAQRPIIFLGDGAPKAKELLAHPQAYVWTAGSTAAFAGDLLLAAYEDKRFEDLVTFEPFYLKNYHATTPKNPLKRLLGKDR